LSTAKTYYIEVKSSKYIADDLADYLENGPLYRDDDGTAQDATHQVVNLRAAAREALDALTRLADSASEWQVYALPAGIVSEVDSAKARLAGVLGE
jgi:hypothetical protein